MRRALRRGPLPLALLLLAGGCLPRDATAYLPVKTFRYRFPGNHVPVALMEELALTTADGVRVAAVLARQEAGPPGPTVLYLHGQDADIDDAWDSVQRLWDRGYHVLALDYRGFGRSAGNPSEAGLYLDAEAALAAVTADLRLAPGRVVIWGRSLGTGVASHLALTAPAAALVLEAPFTSLADMVEWSSPYGVPADWMTDARFDTLGRIARAPLPVVVARGAEDRRVPAWMSDAVYHRAAEPKREVVVPAAGHDEVLALGRDAILAALGAIAPDAVPPPDANPGDASPTPP